MAKTLQRLQSNRPRVITEHFS